MAQAIQIEFKAVGSEQAADAFEKVTKSIGKTQTAQQSLNRISEDSARRLQGLRTYVFEVAGALEQLDPKIGKVVRGLSDVAQGALAGATAFGPWGAAVGGLTSALPLLIEALSDTNTEMSETSRNARQLANDLQLAITQIQNMDRAADFARRRAAGQLSFDEARGLALQAQTSRQQQAEQFSRFLEDRFAAGGASRIRDSLFGPASQGEVGEVRRRIAAATGAGEGSDVFEGIEDQVDALARSFRDLAAAEDVAADAGRRQADQAVRDSLDLTRRTIDRVNGGGGGGGGGRNTEAELARQAREEARALLAVKREQMEVEEKLLELQREQIEAIERAAEAEKESRDKQIAGVDAAIDRFRALWEQQRRAEQDLAEQQADAQEKRRESAEEQKRIEMGLVDLASQGSDAIFEFFRVSEGPQEAIRAAIEGAKAFGSYPDPIGIASHTIAAVGHAANAAKLGFGSSVQTPSGAAAPVGATNGSGGGGDQIVNIDFNSPQHAALVGRSQRRAQRAATRQLARS